MANTGDDTAAEGRFLHEGSCGINACAKGIYGAHCNVERCTGIVRAARPYQPPRLLRLQATHCTLQREPLQRSSAKIPTHCTLQRDPSQ